MKKVIALVLALVLVFSLSVSAFATEATPASKLKDALKEEGLSSFTGLVDGLKEEQLTKIIENEEGLRKIYATLQNRLKSATTAERAVSAVNDAVKEAKKLVGNVVTVSDIKATVLANGIKVTANLKAGNKTVYAAATVTKNGVKFSTGSSPLAAKTGDNLLSVVAVSLAAAAAVLVLAARKSRKVAA